MEMQGKGKILRTIAVLRIFYGGDWQTRTVDLLRVKQAL